ncbi:MAG TPA: hypothetical protein VGK27_04670 [Candidatus Deferrimicrobiaceae bacterium]|jgi:hypothetical protein
MARALIPSFVASGEIGQHAHDGRNRAARPIGNSLLYSMTWASGSGILPKAEIAIPSESRQK